ncbi:MAG: hypothetical protein K8T90_05230 [Planctomycetes bacterium]|nr:hypothetical protein [Planctomycetota bacterium]
MQGELVPVVMFPRFTTLIGEADYETAALDVTDFDRAVLSFEQGVTFPGGGTMTVYFEDSHDGDRWFPLASASLATQIVRLDLPRRWFRMRISITGPAAITCWCAGTLRRRVA